MPMRRMLGLGDLRQGHQERAAAAVLRLHLLVQCAEEVEQALARRSIRAAQGVLEPLLVSLRGPLDVGGDQAVLGSEQAIERRRGDVRGRGHRVDAGRVDAAPIEELVGDLEHPLARLHRGSWRSTCVTAGHQAPIGAKRAFPCIAAQDTCNPMLGIVP